MSGTREAEFDYWLHEVGYRYTGDASMYALTIPEITRLHKGWASIEQKRNGVDPETERLARQQGVSLKRPSNPHAGRAKGSLRESDLRTLREFESRLDGDSHGVN